MRGVAVGEGDVLGIGVRPHRMEQGNGLEDLAGGETGGLLPDEDAGEQHRFAAQHGVAALPTDENDRELGRGFVPQIAEVLERLPVEPLGPVEEEGTGASGQGGYQQTVELAGAARRFTGQIERGEQLLTHRASREPDPESDLADVLIRFECAQAGVDGENLAETGAALDAHHDAGSDRVGDILPDGEQGTGGDHGRIGQVDVLVGDRGHEASASSAVCAVGPGGPSAAGSAGRETGRLGAVRVAREGGARQPAGGATAPDEIRQHQPREAAVGSPGEFGLGPRGGQRAEPPGCLGLVHGGVALALRGLHALPQAACASGPRPFVRR